MSGDTAQNYCQEIAQTVAEVFQVASRAEIVSDNRQATVAAFEKINNKCYRAWQATGMRLGVLSSWRLVRAD